jgi:serine/threonine protein kinase
MCDVLEYLHSLSPPVVHRDFTPENLILNRDGKLVLIDFNVAQQREWTTTGTVVGKHAYLPPEQFRGQPCEQSDLYAMGATIFYLCTGKDPEPISCSHPSKQNPVVDNVLDKIVSTLTAIELSDRYAAIADVRNAFEQANGGRELADRSEKETISSSGGANGAEAVASNETATGNRPSTENELAASNEPARDNGLADANKEEIAALKTAESLTQEEAAEIISTIFSDKSTKQEKITVRSKK